MDPTLFGDVSAGMLRFLGIWYNEWGAFLGFLLALVSTFVIFLDSIRQSISALWYKVAAVVGTLLALPSLVLRVSPEMGNRIGAALVPLAFVGVIGALIAFLAMITYLAWGRRAEQAQGGYVEAAVGTTEANYGPSFTPPSTPAYTPAPPSFSVPPASAPVAPATVQVGRGPATGQPSAAQTQILRRPPKELSRLIVTNGPRAGQNFPLSEKDEGTNIGRDAQGNEISLDDPQMSRYNSRIKLENGVFVIYDLASTNGTLVNGQKILKQPLKNGDEIKIGDTFFQFVEVKSKGGPS